MVAQFMSLAEGAIKSKMKQKNLIKKFNEWDVAAMIRILSKGANANVRNEYGKSLLSQACWYAEYALVEIALRNGANVNEDNGLALMLTIISTNGNTPVKAGYAEKILKLLIEHGANIDQIYPTKYQSESNANALTIAIQNKKLEMANILLDAGTQLKHKDSHGYDALWWAKHIGYKSLVKKISTVSL